MRRRLRPAAVPALLFGLALLWVAAGVGEPEFRADSPGYLANLRSPLFDGDLDLRNEFEHWGRRPPPPTATGRPGNRTRSGRPCSGRRFSFWPTSTSSSPGPSASPAMPRTA